MDVEQVSEPQITLTPNATEYIRKRGGRLYVWADEAGMLRQRFRKPHGRREWATYEQLGVSVLFDRSIAKTKTWTIDVRWFPWRRLEVLWNHVPPPVMDDVPIVLDRLFNR